MKRYGTIVAKSSIDVSTKMNGYSVNHANAILLTSEKGVKMMKSIEYTEYHQYVTTDSIVLITS